MQKVPIAAKTMSKRTEKENFLRLIHIFNGNLVTQYKRAQFQR